MNSPRVTIKLRIGPRDKISPISLLQSQDGNASRDRQEANTQESQAGVQGESGRETLQPSGHNDQESEDATMQDSTANRSLSGSVRRVSGVANGNGTSAQASADFLLLMADPGHVTPQQPSNGACLPNSALKPIPTAAHGDSSTPHETVSISVISTFVSGSAAGCLPSGGNKYQPARGES